MDFEAAGAQAIPANAVWLSWGLAAAGWQHAGGAGTFFVYHNPPPTNFTQAYSLVDKTSANWKPLSGNFSLALSSGYYSAAQANSPWVPAEISQEGLVPASAHSFRLLAEGQFSIYLNSTQIPMSSLGGDLYAGDVSAFAGQMVNLEIVSTSPKLNGSLIIDNLAFTPQVVPEPATVALLTVGFAVWLAGFYRRGRKA